MKEGYDFYTALTAKLFRKSEVDITSEERQYTKKCLLREMYSGIMHDSPETNVIIPELLSNNNRN